jgi:hypothetical protein
MNRSGQCRLKMDESSETAAARIAWIPRRVRIGLTQPDDALYNDFDPHHCRKLTKGGRHVRNPGV